MGLFGRGNKKPDAAKAPAPAPRAEPDFFSPLWTDWPPEPTEAAPVAEPPVVESELVAEASPVVETPAGERITIPAPEIATEMMPRARPTTNPPPVPGPAVVVQRVRAISDVPPPVSPAPRVTPSTRMRAALERRDWPEARALAEAILADDPTDLDAHVCVEACAQRMRELNALRLGARDRLLRQSLPDDWLSDMELDPQVAFVLSRIDGASTIEDILEICGVPRDDAVRILVDLLEDGVIEALPPPRRPSSSPPR
jgi:hypothetical protein